MIEKIGKITIIESKSIHDYLQQLDNMGEDVSEYESIYGYSLSETEPRNPIFEYPAYDYGLTKEMTNLDLQLAGDKQAEKEGAKDRKKTIAQAKKVRDKATHDLR